MIDWIAAVFELSGSWLVGNKKKFGFLLNILGDFVWIYLGIVSELYGLVAVATVALGFNIRNYRKWRKPAN